MANDLRYSRNGDFVFHTNDFLDTDGYELEGENVRQMVRTVVLSLPGDWRNQPLMTANLDKFVGAPNRRDTAEKLKKQVESSIKLFITLSGSQLYVRVFPISTDTLAIYTEIKYTNSNNETRIINDLFTGPNAIAQNPRLVAAN